MENENEWGFLNSGKMCSELRKKVMGFVSAHKRTSGILYNALAALRHYFTSVPVIVQIDSGHYFTRLNTDNLGGVLGCYIDQKLDVINGFSTRINIKTLKRLVNNEAVVKVWLDRKVSINLNVASPAVKASPLWDHGVRGDGIGIAVIDTGIYPHPDLTAPRNRIIKFKDFVNQRAGPYDDNGHGTHCAGCAGGNGNKSNGKYRGPAPNANLIGVKVLDKKGAGVMSKVLAGIQWCIQNKNKYGIRILSMSLGANTTESYRDDPLCQAVRKAWEDGLVVCVAAGNNGPSAKTINTPGIAPEAITVGASDDKNTVATGDDSIASFSSRGPTPDGISKPDIVTPGAKIVSLRVPNSYISWVNKKSKINHWYASLSGTSMATAICSGIVALILQGSPSLAPDEVKKILISSCRSLYMESNAQGAGLVDAQAAFHKASKSQNSKN